MTKTLTQPGTGARTAFTVGRRGFAKISAVEGLQLTPEMEAQFLEFDRQGLSGEERREAIARIFGKSR
jgi:hypothetical protein